MRSYWQVLGLLALVVISPSARANMGYGAFPAIGSCINESNGAVTENKVCSTSPTYSANANLYTGQPITATVVGSATASGSAEDTEVGEHITLSISLSDPTNFFYQLGQMVTLARIHVCQNVKFCDETMSVRDVSLTLNRDTGQPTLSGSVETDLVFDGGSETAQEIEWVELLIPGVFQAVNVGQ